MEKHYFVLFVSKLFKEALSSDSTFKYSKTKHLSNSTRKAKMKQTFIKDTFEDKNPEFSLDICNTFLASDIP